MQKRIIGIIFLGIFFLTGIANAGIISLPRYNPDMNQRSSSGGITRTCAQQTVVRNALMNMRDVVIILNAVPRPIVINILRQMQKNIPVRPRVKIGLENITKIVVIS